MPTASAYSYSTPTYHSTALSETCTSFGPLTSAGGATHESIVSETKLASTTTPPKRQRIAPSTIMYPAPDTFTRVAPNTGPTGGSTTFT